MASGKSAVMPGPMGQSDSAGRRPVDRGPVRGSGPAQAQWIDRVANANHDARIWDLGLVFKAAILLHPMSLAPDDNSNLKIGWDPGVRNATADGIRSAGFGKAGLTP